MCIFQLLTGWFFKPMGQKIAARHDEDFAHHGIQLVQWLIDRLPVEAPRDGHKTRGHWGPQVAPKEQPFLDLNAIGGPVCSLNKNNYLSLERFIKLLAKKKKRTTYYFIFFVGLMFFANRLKRIPPLFFPAGKQVRFLLFDLLKALGNDEGRHGLSKGDGHLEAASAASALPNGSKKFPEV